jgi:hypothetical protein
MNASLLVRSMLLTSAALVVAGYARAQDAPKSEPKQAPASEHKAASKPRKVWTDDDLGALHRTSVISVAKAQTPSMPQAAQTGTDATPADAQPKSRPAGPKGPDALAHPKTADDADRMIAWEQRDIDAQQEYVDRLQTQVEQAPPDQREHMQKTLAERQQILADTRREQQDLMAQKKLLEKKKAGDSSVTASSSPQ